MCVRGDAWGLGFRRQFQRDPFLGVHGGGWQEVVMLRHLRITRSLIPSCSTSRAIYVAPFHRVRVGEQILTIPPSPMCGLQWLYAIVNAHEKTGSSNVLVLAWVHLCRSLPTWLLVQGKPSISCILGPWLVVVQVHELRVEPHGSCACAPAWLRAHRLPQIKLKCA